MANRTDPEKHRGQVRAANRARYKATQELIEAHQSEFDGYYAKHAASEGVTPSPRGRINAEALQAQIDNLQARLAQMQKDGASSA